MFTYFIQYDLELKEFTVTETGFCKENPYTSKARLSGSEDSTYICCYNPSVEEGKKDIYKALLAWVSKERSYLESLELEAINFLGSK